MQTLYLKERKSHKRATWNNNDHNEEACICICKKKGRDEKVYMSTAERSIHNHHQDSLHLDNFSYKLMYLSLLQVQVL